MIRSQVSGIVGSVVILASIANAGDDGICVNISTSKILGEDGQLRDYLVTASFNVKKTVEGGNRFYFDIRNEGDKTIFIPVHDVFFNNNRFFSEFKDTDKRPIGFHYCPAPKKFPMPDGAGAELLTLSSQDSVRIGVAFQPMEIVDGTVTITFENQYRTQWVSRMVEAGSTGVLIHRQVTAPIPNCWIGKIQVTWPVKQGEIDTEERKLLADARNKLLDYDASYHVKRTILRKLGVYRDRECVKLIEELIGTMNQRSDELLRALEKDPNAPKSPTRVDRRSVEFEECVRLLYQMTQFGAGYLALDTWVVIAQCKDGSLISRLLALNVLHRFMTEAEWKNEGKTFFKPKPEQVKRAHQVLTKLSQGDQKTSRVAREAENLLRTLEKDLEF